MSRHRSFDRTVASRRHDAARALWIARFLVATAMNGWCLLGTGGCYLSHERPSPGSDAADRFTGRWAVFDADLRALSGGSVYELGPDGTLALLAVWALPAGGVTQRESGISCEFRDRWWADDDATLWLSSTCTDGSMRDVELRFPTDRATDGDGTSVDIVTVDGEAGWGPLEGVSVWTWASCDCATPETWFANACCDAG